MPTFRIDELFLDKSTPDNAYRLETFRSTGSISATASRQLRCHFVTKCNFPSNSPTAIDGKTDIRMVSDSAFLDKATQNTLDLYQQVLPFLQPRSHSDFLRFCGMSREDSDQYLKSSRLKARRNVG